MGGVCHARVTAKITSKRLVEIDFARRNTTNLEYHDNDAYYTPYTAAEAAAAHRNLLCIVLADSPAFGLRGIGQ